MRRLSDCLSAWSDRPAPYVSAGASEPVSYLEMHATARAHAAVLAQLDAGGSIVALLASNSPSAVACYWSLQVAGAVVVWLDPRAAGAELVATIGASDCDWVACDEACREAAAGVAERLRIGLIVVQRDGLDVPSRPAHRRPNRMPGDVAVMCVTSGSAGIPKPVMLSHANLMSNADAHIESLRLRADDVALVVLPMAFSYAHTSQLLCHTKLGGRLVLYDQAAFVPKHFCELVERCHVTVTSVVPTLLHILDQYRHLREHDLGSLRYLCCGGAPMAVDVARSVAAKLPHMRVIHTYGLTEASPRVTTLGPADDPGKLPSIGKPIPGVEVAIVDDTGGRVPTNTIGELVVRGPNVMVGYYGAPERTRAAIAGGWLRTGDLARQDDEGYIFLAGRAKDVIITGGSNVHPEEIETVLVTHPHVSGAVVRAEPDAGLGEVPVAYVSVRRGAALSVQQVHEFLNGKLAAWKWPRKVYVRGALPRTRSGKPRRCRVH